MRALLLLPCVLLLLKATDGNQKYNQLSEHETNIIDQAIREANGQYKPAKHLDFDSIIKADENKKMLHVLLKPTSCDKMIQSVHREDCEIQSRDRPQVSCVDCRGNMSCHLLKEKEKIHDARIKCLNPPTESPGNHLIGKAHAMFVLGENEKQIGCLGCV